MNQSQCVRWAKVTGEIVLSALAGAILLTIALGLLVVAPLGFVLGAVGWGLVVSACCGFRAAQACAEEVLAAAASGEGAEPHGP